MSADSATNYRFISDMILVSLIFLLLLLTLVLIFFKQKNVPVSQCIEVDPREPHSITITFVPANLTDSAIATINTNQNNNTAATATATATGMSDTRNGSIASANASQTAAIA